MPTTYKVLGQVAPSSAVTETTIYTCPSATQTVVSSIVICNRAITDGTFRISIRPDGASLANQHYIAFDSECTANNTVALTLGITLDANDVVSVYASNTSFSFSLFGSEIT